MPKTKSADDKKRRNPEPEIPDVDPADLDNDQADSGPDRDRKELGG